MVSSPVKIFKIYLAKDFFGLKLGPVLFDALREVSQNAGQTGTRKCPGAGAILWGDIDRRLTAPLGTPRRRSAGSAR